MRLAMVANGIVGSVYGKSTYLCVANGMHTHGTTCVVMNKEEQFTSLYVCMCVYVCVYAPTSMVMLFRAWTTDKVTVLGKARQWRSIKGDVQAKPNEQQ